MVACRTVEAMPITTTNTIRSSKSPNSNSTAFRLLNGNKLEADSTVSKNSVYKLKIDLMFDDTRSALSSQFNDTRGSHRTRSIIMYGRSELGSTQKSDRSIANLLQKSMEAKRKFTINKKKYVKRTSNSVQEQIEQLFTDVAKDATSNFSVIYLGSLALKDKVTSLQGLQEPLRELYLKELNTKCSGLLEICATGLRVKINSSYGKEKNYENITPFHNIAVWSAVKFVEYKGDGGSAFLPLITDPENMDNSSLFRPLCGIEESEVLSNEHAPIFAVVMRSAGLSKGLKCHAFLCKCAEDAIVIAATLYQSLMTHVTTSHRSNNRRTPRNQNGVSCISIASSSARTGSNYLSNSQALSIGRKSPVRSSSDSISADAESAPRLGRKKRGPNVTLTTGNNKVEITTEERKRKSHKNRLAPPTPHVSQPSNMVRKNSTKTAIELQQSHCNTCGVSEGGRHISVTESLGYSETNGDILTRVAIPRSGSFLNTGGLTRYKSRAARRHSDKLGGGGGSPLGFSELFNEFRMHENLHSLDEILYAIIDADGMSFNDLKPIYKEFLLKLAVTLTKDELFQRSKNIMRRQRKKKLKLRNGNSISQKKTKALIFNTKSLKKVFHLDQFTSCRDKQIKLQNKKKRDKKQQEMGDFTHQPPINERESVQQRARAATSGWDGFHRNSSSGYVSCSECSYDSESCTCTSADRCYCSLRPDQTNNKTLWKNNKRNLALSNRTIDSTMQNLKYTSIGDINRDSLISCKSDEKCYCSMAEEANANTLTPGEFANPHSDTTLCDTDSCVSTSKCYCQHVKIRSKSNCDEINTSKFYHDCPSNRNADEKLALSYELLTISGNENSVQPQVALSVKKSLEAAAIFADVKLNQSTDIKSKCPFPKTLVKAAVSPKKKGNKIVQSAKSGEFLSIDRKHKTKPQAVLSGKLTSSADDLLGKFISMEMKSKSVKSARTKNKSPLNEVKNIQSIQSGSHLMHVVNASLEDTLGYLP